jgi:hypothetical protein
VHRSLPSAISTLQPLRVFSNDLSTWVPELIVTKSGMYIIPSVSISTEYFIDASQIVLFYWFHYAYVLKNYLSYQILRLLKESRLLILRSTSSDIIESFHAAEALSDFRPIRVQSLKVTRHVAFDLLRLQKEINHRFKTRSDVEATECHSMHTDDETRMLHSRE